MIILSEMTVMQSAFYLWLFIT